MTTASKAQATFVDGGTGAQAGSPRGDTDVGPRDDAARAGAARIGDVERTGGARGGWALGALALATVLPSLATSSANVGLPALVQAFGVPFQYAQWVVLAYLLAMTVSVVAAGRLGDLAGRRRMLLAGLALFTLASFACGAADSIGVLIAARAVQGIGAALLMALTMAFVADAVPRGRTGSAMGLLGTMSAVGTALGPTVGGFVLAASGWRGIFLLNVPLGVAALLIAWRALPAASAPPTASALPTASAFPAAPATPSARPWAGRGLALLRDRPLAMACVMSCLVMTVMMATLVVGPFHLAGAVGLSAVGVGLAMSCGPIVSALAGVPGGRLVDRWGARRAMRAGLISMLIGSAGLAMTPLATRPAGAQTLSLMIGVAAYVLPLVVLTAGYALFQAANNTSVMASVLPDRRGVVSGMLTLSRNIGLLAGASAMGAVFAYGVGSKDIVHATAPAIASGTQLAFVAAAALIACALLLAARTPAAPQP